MGLRDGAFEGVFVGWGVGFFVGCNTIKKVYYCEICQDIWYNLTTAVVGLNDGDFVG